MLLEAEFVCDGIKDYIMDANPAFKKLMLDDVITVTDNDFIKRFRFLRK